MGENFSGNNLLCTNPQIFGFKPKLARLAADVGGHVAAHLNFLFEIINKSFDCTGSYVHASIKPQPSYFYTLVKNL